ncbi:hypothetical protein P8452_33105 [Trifolium repens]|nr:hypothetical protein P8452_33105 [Trifolium repens]
MLFAIDLSSKGGSSIGGSFRVKRVCMDSKVIKSFCAEYPLFAPPKGIYGCVDLDSDVDSISNDSGGEVEAMEFAKDVIVTPPIRSVKVEDDGEAPPMNSAKEVDDGDAPFIVKRNLSKSFDKVAGGKCRGRLKKIKVEKE